MADVTPLPAYACTCGEVNVRAHDRIKMLEEQLDISKENYELCDRDLRKSRSAVRRLERERDHMRKNDPRREDAMKVLEHWRKVCCPTAKELGGARLDNVLVRLGSYSVVDLMRSADGYALKPYVVNGRRTHEGPIDSWHADAHFIYGQPKNVDQGIRIATRADELRTMFDAAPSEPERKPSVVEASTLSVLGAAAHAAAQRGLPVFPCKPADKAPATRNGFKDAKVDLASIDAFWTKKPDCNVAIPTGQVSGLVVLDLDGEEGWDSLHHLEDMNEELPTTLSVKTPRGGMHFYFRWPGQEISNTAGFPGPGLDFRGDGGYVLIPPSVGFGGNRYEKDEECAPTGMPEWLLELMVTGQERRQKAVASRDWGKWVREGSAQGERDTRMTSYVGHLIGKGLIASEVYEIVAIVNRNVKPPLAEKDLQRIVGSIAKKHASRA